MSEQGKCPKCGSGELSYESIVLGRQEDEVRYPLVCDKCGYEGDEVYSLTFEGFDPE